MAVACRRFFDDNPLAKGRIPAASFPPEQHWDRIASNDNFVREMLKHIGKKHERGGQSESAGQGTSGEKQGAKLNWKTSQRLSSLTSDEACEYPDITDYSWHHSHAGKSMFRISLRM